MLKLAFSLFRLCMNMWRFIILGLYGCSGRFDVFAGYSYLSALHIDQNAYEVLNCKCALGLYSGK